MFSTQCSVIGINFFITLGVSGVINQFLVGSNKYKNYISFIWAAGTIGFYALYTESEGVPSGGLVGGGNLSNSDRDIFVLGLIAGCVTFGGAYTTLPFIYAW
jgi:hypothetical protein